MSKDSLLQLQVDRPDLSQAIAAITEWLSNLSVKPPFSTDPNRIWRQHKTIPIDKLAQALNEMARRGMAKKEYRFRTADGIVVGTAFPSPEKSPPEFQDTLTDHTYLKSEGDIVPFYTFVDK